MLLADLAFSQSTDSTLKFEAAEIHPTPAPAPGTNNQNMRGGLYRSGRYEVRSATMLDLVRTAYNVDANNVAGGPAWMDKVRFDIIAKAPGDSTPEKLRVMLRNLLAERFGLVVHNDASPRAAYAIRQGKKVLMKQSAGSDLPGCKPMPPPTPPGALTTYMCHNVSMPELPDQLRNMVLVTKALNGAPVVDQTQLKGGWDFDIKYSLNTVPPQAQSDAPPEVVNIFAAFEKQLGLKLELTKVPVPVIAVDSVSEKPTPNLNDDPPGVTAKMSTPPPLEFEVAEIRPSDPNPPQDPSGDCFYCPGGRLHISRFTMGDLIATAWNLNGNYDSRVIGLPKSLEKANWDIIARVSTMIPVNTSGNGTGTGPPAQQVDFDSVRIMLQALLKDRFKLALHEETRQLNGYAVVSVKPKLKRADPDNRPGCKEGPGPEGLGPDWKDPRTTNPQARRLLTCLSMTVAEFVAELPNRAGDYFAQYPGRVVDATRLEGRYDFTVNFSPLGIAMGGGANGASGEAAGYPISLPEAIEKQLGLRLEPRKNPATVLVVDYVAEKPAEN